LLRSQAERRRACLCVRLLAAQRAGKHADREPTPMPTKNTLVPRPKGKCLAPWGEDVFI